MAINRKAVEQSKSFEELVLKEAGLAATVQPAARRAAPRVNQRAEEDPKARLRAKIAKRFTGIGKDKKESSNPADWHQMNVAKKVLRTSDVMNRVLGGMTKDEARAVLRKAGWSDARIASYENGKREGRVVETDIPDTIFVVKKTREGGYGQGEESPVVAAFTDKGKALEFKRTRQSRGRDEFAVFKQTGQKAKDTIAAIGVSNLSFDVLGQTRGVDTDLPFRKGGRSEARVSEAIGRSFFYALATEIREMQDRISKGQFVHVIAQMLAEQNPQFSFDKFYKAAGVKESAPVGKGRIIEALSRKDFVAWAKFLKELPESFDKSELVGLLSDFLEGQNPRFDRERFFKACGVQGGTEAPKKDDEGDKADATGDVEVESKDNEDDGFDSEVRWGNSAQRGYGVNSPAMMAARKAFRDKAKAKKDAAKKDDKDESNVNEAAEGLDDFARGYAEAALFSTNDESNEQGGEPLDQNFGVSDIAPATLASMKADCDDFQKTNAELLAKWYELGETEEKAGMDFWFTRNRHGAGFWDRGYGDQEISKIGRELTDMAKPYGEVYLYVGDDGKIHSDDEASGTVPEESLQTFQEAVEEMVAKEEALPPMRKHRYGYGRPDNGPSEVPGGVVEVEVVDGEVRGYFTDKVSAATSEWTLNDRDEPVLVHAPKGMAYPTKAMRTLVNMMVKAKKGLKATSEGFQQVTEATGEEHRFDLIAPIAIYHWADVEFKDKAAAALKQWREEALEPEAPDTYDENGERYEDDAEDLDDMSIAEWAKDTYNDLFAEVVSEIHPDWEEFTDKYGSFGFKNSQGKVVFTGDSAGQFPWYETRDLLAKRIQTEESKVTEGWADQGHDSFKAAWEYLTSKGFKRVGKEQRDLTGDTHTFEGPAGRKAMLKKTRGGQVTTHVQEAISEGEVAQKVRDKVKASDFADAKNVDEVLASLKGTAEAEKLEPTDADEDELKTLAQEMFNKRNESVGAVPATEPTLGYIYEDANGCRATITALYTRDDGARCVAMGSEITTVEGWKASCPVLVGDSKIGPKLRGAKRIMEIAAAPTPQPEPEAFDVEVYRDNSMVVFTLNTTAAREWVDENVQLEGWQWMGMDSFAVDLRFAAAVKQGMEEGGLSVDTGETSESLARNLAERAVGILGGDLQLRYLWPMLEGISQTQRVRELFPHVSDEVVQLIADILGERAKNV